MVASEDPTTRDADNVDVSPHHEQHTSAPAAWREAPATSTSFERSALPAETYVAPVPRPHNAFPMKLLDILGDPIAAGVIEWLNHGHAFAIVNQDRFIPELMPRFTRGKLTSFQRQLNLYGFRKVTKGMDCKAGALVYFHPAFKRGRPEMMQGIRRIACKGELSLNRLRNDDVPYDPTVPSEEAEGPEHDVNSLDKATRKRMRGWRHGDHRGKRHGTEGFVSGHGHAIAPLDRGHGRMPRRADGGYLMGEISPGKLAGDLGAVVNPDFSMRPAAPPVLEFRDVSAHGKHFAFPPSGMRQMQRVYTEDPTKECMDGAGPNTPPASTGISSDSTLNMAHLYTQRGFHMPPLRKTSLSPHLPSRIRLGKGPARGSHAQSSEHAVEKRMMSPPKGN